MLGLLNSIGWWDPLPLVQLSITLTILELPNLPSCPSRTHSLVRFLCLLWHSQLGGRFLPSGLEATVSQHLLHHSSLSISSSFLPPSSTPGPLHPSHAGSRILLSPFAPKERKAKCPAMTAEPREGTVTSSWNRWATQRDQLSKVMQDTVGRPEGRSLSYASSMRCGTLLYSRHLF